MILPILFSPTVMEDQVPSARIFRFGRFVADGARSTLSRSDSRVRIQEQPFRVLLLLLERPGEIITREELRQKLWPEGTFVDFDGSLNVILRKLRSALDDDSENPIFIETVPRKGYRFVAPVVVESTSTSPSQPGGVTPVAAADVPQNSTLITGTRNSAVHLISIAAAVLLLVIGALEWSGRRDLPRVRDASVPTVAASVTIPRKSVAVLGFHNLSAQPDEAWLSTAFSEMLSTELAAGEKLRLVSGEDVANLRLSSPWSQTDTLGRETTTHIGTVLNSDVLVLGSYASVGRRDHRQMRVDVRVQDARTGEILGEIAETGSDSNFFQLISQIGAKVRNRLGVPSVVETDEPGILASLSSNADAARLYTLGLVKLREYDYLTAKTLFQEAIKADPKFPLSHTMMARCWAQLGYQQQRRAEAKNALDLSGNLARVTRLLIEGDYYESVADHAKAASSYQALFALVPDSVEHGLQLALAQIAAGQKPQAMATIAQLRRLPPPASTDPRLDLAEERAIPDDKTAALALVRSALAKAKAQDRDLVYAQARKEECMVLTYGDYPQGGAASCEDASKTFLASGNRLEAADSIRLVADSQGDHGQFQQAIVSYQQALAILKTLGEEHEKTGAILNNMAGVYMNQGQLDEAEQLYRKAKYHFAKAGNLFNEEMALVNIADVLYIRGKLPDASKLYQQAIASLALLDPAAPGYAMYRLADLKLAQGQTKSARDLAAQAVDVIKPSHRGYESLSGAMTVLGDVLLAQGDYSAARQQYKQALDGRQRLGEQILVAESQTSLATVLLEEGRSGQAEPLLRTAISEFEKEKENPDASESYILLSRTLLAQKKMQEARTAIQRASQLSHNTPDPALTLTLGIQDARVLASDAVADANGRSAFKLARQKLLSAIASAKRLGYYRIECEGQLALSELELKANSDSDRSPLENLRQTAHERGLELISRKAQLLASSSGSVPSEP